jgi:hypothetical protein
MLEYSFLAPDLPDLPECQGADLVSHIRERLERFQPIATKLLADGWWIRNTISGFVVGLPEDRFPTTACTPTDIEEDRLRELGIGEEFSPFPTRPLADVWAAGLNLHQQILERDQNLDPMQQGRLRALCWVFGSEWDDPDTHEAPPRNSSADRPWSSPC